MAATDAAPFQARFTVRGRWEGPELTWRVAVADEPGPVPLSELRAAVEAAAAAWNATGGIRLRPAVEGEKADVTWAWVRGDHGPCQPFGRDTSVAHAGPTGMATFVHLDAAREWGPAGHDLLRTVTHEFGHVLGLDHSDDPDALMAYDPAIDTPGPSDLAGLHSLYGGGRDGPGDLHITRNGRIAAPALRRVGPEGLTDFTLFDTDGDGDDEVLVWRTDTGGFGRLVIHHFEAADAGPRLTRTVGPLLGAVPAGSRTSFRTGDDGRRWIVSWLGDGGRRLRRFDDRGWLADPSPLEARGAPASPASRDPRRARGDLDGDGETEDVMRAALR